MGAVVPIVSWLGLAQPSTTGSAETGKDVDGRHEHALGGPKARPEGPAMTRKWPVPAMLAPTGTSRAMTQDKRGHDNEQAASGPRPPPLQQVDVEYPAVAPLLLRNQFGN